ncbi:MAG TPA: autotransporter domain-containing protein [Sphingobium sp.]
MSGLKSSTCLAALAAAAIALPAGAQTNSQTIQITNTDGASGIVAASGSSGTITNDANGKIIIDETYAPTDTDNDGDLDGPFATGSNRAGIRTLGAYTGTITNSGAIMVEGNDSAGIALGGPLTGGLKTDGSISVLGDRSVGVRTGDITGPVRIAGTVTAQGKDASAAVIGGNVTGAAVFQGSLASTGYRYTTPPTDPGKLDADDLLQGGPTVSIAGNVSGGVVFAVPPKDNSPTDTDEDKDGIEDSKEGSAAITSYGSTAAVRIGAADHALTLGPVAGTAFGHGLIAEGVVVGSGVYSGIDGNGIQIGGLGGSVSIAGGATISGTVRATSNGAAATAIRIGNAATMPEIRVSGVVEAAGKTATAILVEAGANTAAIRNSGIIRATGTGENATAAAIVDRSGTLTTVENSGAIIATTAIDLSANSSGATIRQTAVVAGVTAPRIDGAIVFGSGSDLLDIADGTVTGKVTFGAGDNRLSLSGDGAYSGQVQFGAGNDRIDLAGTSSFSGSADFGGGTDSLILNGTSSFSGTLTNSAGVALAINGGTMNLSGKASLRSLDMGASGLLTVMLDPASRTAPVLDISGGASFADGAKVAVRINGITNAEGRYSLLRAGTITGADKLATNGTLLPFLFKSSLASVSPTELAIDITRKTAGELGLNRSQAAAYDAVYQALAKDEKVAGVFLGTYSGEGFRQQLRQMLPDHAGGTFEATSLASRTMIGALSDPNAPYADQGKWGYWVQQIAFGRAKSIGDTASYDISGWGLSTGAELKTGIGRVGLSIAYVRGEDGDGETDNEVHADQYEAAVHWRANWGRFIGYARGSYGRIAFGSQRQFTGTSGAEQVRRSAAGSWNGDLVSAAAGASYETSWGMLRLRPSVSADYFRLHEGGHTETGGGDAFNLIVGARTSDELAVSGALAAALEFGSRAPGAGWFRMELEGGRRELVGGSLGVTRASFVGGQSFTLLPDERTGGWTGKLRAVAGGEGVKFAAEAGAEQQQNRAALSLRASLMVGL